MLYYFQSVGDWVALIVLFGLCIFVHELGHFLAARSFGMVIETFSLGFGPAIWKRKVGGTTYKIAWIPLGGYVALPQLDPSGMSRLQGGTDAGNAPELPYVHPWKRIVVCAAGPFGNVLFAVVLALIVYMWPVMPEDTLVPGTVIGGVDTHSAAYAAGVRIGDEIVTVNGKSVHTWYEFNVETTLAAGKSNRVDLLLRSAEGERVVNVPVKNVRMGVRFVEGVYRGETCVFAGIKKGSAAEAAGFVTNDIPHTVNGVSVLSVDHFREMIRSNEGQTVTIEVERGGSRTNIAVTPRYDKSVERAVIGVDIRALGQAALPWMLYRSPWDQIRSDVRGIFRLLRALVTPREAKHAAEGMGGITMILLALWRSIQISWVSGIGFLRFLNINLAVLNFLPIPVLDGGHIMFFLWEWVTGRRVHPRVQSVLTNTMLVLLIGAMVLINVRDVIRLPQWLNGGGLAEETTNAVPGRVSNSLENAAATGIPPATAVSTGAPPAAGGP